MKQMELIIASNANDRMEVAKILVKNGYRVYSGTKKVGSAKKAVLIIDKPEAGTES